MKNSTTVTKEYSIENKYKVLGFNDDECNCDVCGRQELKGTYAIEDLSTGEIFRAGSVCGAKMAGWTTKQLVANYNATEKENLNKAKLEYSESKEYKAMQAALDFLDKERSELHKKIFNCNTEAEILEIKATERTFKSRMEYLSPLGDACRKKENEIKAKYNIPKFRNL
jgi:hypothetical protein